MKSIMLIYCLFLELAFSLDNISDNTSHNSTCFNFDITIPTILSQFLLALIILGLNIMVVTVICLSKCYDYVYEIGILLSSSNRTNSVSELSKEEATYISRVVFKLNFNKYKTRKN